MNSPFLVYNILAIPTTYECQTISQNDKSRWFYNPLHIASEVGTQLPSTPKTVVTVRLIQVRSKISIHWLLPSACRRVQEINCLILNYYHVTRWQYSNSPIKKLKPLMYSEGPKQHKSVKLLAIADVTFPCGKLTLTVAMTLLRTLQHRTHFTGVDTGR